jgi:YD repeat-containing protein
MNQTTKFGYDGAGHVVKMAAVLPGGAVEETEYVYGVVKGQVVEALAPLSSAVSSNDLLAYVKYPTKAGTTHPASVDITEQNWFVYNALGEVTAKSDQNGAIHSYYFDSLGRVNVETISNDALSPMGSIKRVETMYSGLGLPQLITSFSDVVGTQVLNQVARVYNSHGQLFQESQAHHGMANNSPYVTYNYDIPNGGRLTSVVYPSGYTVSYEYGSATELNYMVSRLDHLSETVTGTLKAVESYTYMGLSTVVQRSYNQVGAFVTCLAQAGEPVGDAGDRVIGLDRFGRVVDQRWRQTSQASSGGTLLSATAGESQLLAADDGTSLSTESLPWFEDPESFLAYIASVGLRRADNLGALQASPTWDETSLLAATGPVITDADRYQYTYDENGNVKLKANLLNRGLDESDGYDSLNRLLGVDRVSGTDQSWALDALGNMTSVTTGTTTAARTHNGQNQITASTGWPLPTTTTATPPGTTRAASSSTMDGITLPKSGPAGRS